MTYGTKGISHLWYTYKAISHIQAAGLVHWKPALASESLVTAVADLNKSKIHRNIIFQRSKVHGRKSKKDECQRRRRKRTFARVRHSKLQRVRMKRYSTTHDGEH